MALWQRDTPWRQGSLLRSGTARALSLLTSESQLAAAVVISHDCDLAQETENEPSVEVILGRFIAKADGNCTYSKNARRLHLPFTGGERSAVVELVATQKRQVLKEGDDGLAGHLPDAQIRLRSGEQNILQKWLAARYRRAALPDEFNRRIEKETKLGEAFLQVLKKYGAHLPAIFFDVDEGDETTRNGPDDTYSLAIYLLYSTEVDPELAERDALAAETAIKVLFAKECQQANGKWRWIELTDFVILADRAMTYSQSVHLKQWSLEYLSLRSDPPAVSVD